jgi:hypothetical protein
VGRTLADGTDEESANAARMDTWIAWQTEETTEVERSTPGVTASCSSRFLLVCFSFLLFGVFVGGSLAPDDPRTAHLRRVEEIGYHDLHFYAVISGTYLFGMTPLVCREI